MAKHFKQRALLVEALGPGTPQLTIDEFDSVDAAREELRVRYEHYSKDCFEGSSLEHDHAIIYSDNWPGEWRVFEVHSPSPKRNPNAAVSCECSGRIGTRIGDTPYKYEEL